MGLISRVSSRTYRFPPSITKTGTTMRLSILLLLTCLLATSYVVKANEDDVDAEVIDDDAGIEDVTQEATGDEEPQLMPMPLDGVRSFIYFPDGAHTITGGKVSELVIGVQNNGDIDIEMMSCSGKMLYPPTRPSPFSSPPRVSPPKSSSCTAPL